MTDLPDSQKLYPENMSNLKLDNSHIEKTKQENEPADLDYRKGKGCRHPTLKTQFAGNSQRDGLKVDKKTDDVYDFQEFSGQNISKLPKKPLVDSEERFKKQVIKQKTCENKGSKDVNIGTSDKNAITGLEKDLANNRNMAKDFNIGSKAENSIIDKEKDLTKNRNKSKAFNVGSEDENTKTDEEKDLTKNRNETKAFNVGSEDENTITDEEKHLTKNRNKTKAFNVGSEDENTITDEEKNETDNRNTAKDFCIGSKDKICTSDDKITIYDFLKPKYKEDITHHVSVFLEVKKECLFLQKYLEEFKKSQSFQKKKNVFGVEDHQVYPVFPEFVNILLYPVTSLTLFEEFNNEASRLASLCRLPANFQVMATFLARNGHYMPHGIDASMEPVTTECYSCGWCATWNPDTTACNTRLHNENCEFREYRQRFVEQPLFQFTDEFRRVDGQNDLPEVQVGDAIQNRDLDLVTVRDSHATFTAQPSECGDNQNASHSIETSSTCSRTPDSRMLKYEYLSNLTFINYCTLSSFFEGLHKTLCLHPATKNRFLEYLSRSRFRVNRILVEVIKKLDANQTKEAIKFWIFQNFSLKEIQRKWVKNDGVRDFIDLFGTEENTTLQKIGETLKSFFLGCTCTSDRILLYPVERSVRPKDIVQTSVSEFLDRHGRFCQFGVGGGNVQCREYRRRFEEQPRILPLPFTDELRRVVGQNDLPMTLQVGDARYNLAFYIKWKNYHFTAVVYNHSSNEWEDVGAPQSGASSEEKSYISTVYYFLHIPAD